AAASFGWRRRPPQVRPRADRPGRASRPSAPTRGGPRSRRACGRRGSGAACATPPPRSPPTPGPRRARGRAADGSRRHLRPQAADRERPRAAAVPCSRFVLLGRDRALGEQVAAQLTVQRRVVAPQPLERHRRVLLLVVAVVLEDRPELVVGGCDRPLVVPVDRLELLHDRDGRAVTVDRLGPKRLRRLVQGCAGRGHSTPPIARSAAALSLSKRNLPADLRGHVLDLEVLVDAFVAAFAPEPRLLDAPEGPGRVR